MDLLIDLQEKLEADEAFNSNPLSNDINLEALSAKSPDYYDDILNLTKYCVKNENYEKYIDILFDLMHSLHSQIKSTVSENQKSGDNKAKKDDAQNYEDLNKKINELNITVSNLQKENANLVEKISELQKKERNSPEIDDNPSDDINARIQSFNKATEQMIFNLEKRENHLDAYLSHMKEEFDYYLSKKSSK